MLPPCPPTPIKQQGEWPHSQAPYEFIRAVLCAAAGHQVVVAESRAVAQRCRLLGSDAMLLVASPPTPTPGLVLREILAQVG